MSEKHTPGLIWRCDSCRRIVTTSELLEAQHPFLLERNVYGCPKCKEVMDTATNVCDEPGCDEEATCGWPSKRGYRRTCHGHMEAV